MARTTDRLISFANGIMFTVETYPENVREDAIEQLLDILTDKNGLDREERAQVATLVWARS